MRDLLASSFFSGASSSSASLRGWWEDVNESPQWQDAAFFSLTAAYALVSAVALVSPQHLPFPFLFPFLSSSDGMRLGTAETRLLQVGNSLDNNSSSNSDSRPLGPAVDLPPPP
jgi:hypothetical protein